MPALSPLLAFDVSTSAAADAFAPSFAVSTRSTSGNSDFLEWDFNVTAELAAALASSVQVIAVQIEIDQGDGELTPLLQTEIEGAVQMSSSREGYGASTLSFALKVPPSESPFYSAWSRAPHRVKMTGYLGLPAAMQQRPMFDGFVTLCTWEAYPSLLRIECQDISVLWVSEKLAFNLEPGSLRTRKGVFIDVLELYAIPYGQLDFGTNDGGLIYKGISEGGTVDLLTWMVAYLTPIGRRMRWDSEGVNVEPSYASSPVVRTFRSNDIANLSVALSGTTDTTAVVMSSSVFAYIGPSGQRTEVEIKLTRAEFAPEVAIKRQDHTTGAIEDLTLSIEPAVQEVGKTVTTRVYDAGTIVMTTVEEWGWYSARACRREQTAETGDVSFNSAFDVFQHPDGTWRLEVQQQYQVLRFTRAYKNWNADGTLNSEEVGQSQFGIGIVPVAGFHDDVTERPVHAFLNEDGVAWVAGREYYGGAADRPQAINGGFVDTVTRTLYSSDDAGHLTRTYRKVLSNGDYYIEVPPETLDVIRDAGGFTTTTPGIAAWAVFQTAAGKKYGISYRLSGGTNSEFPVVAYVTKFFTPIDESTHREQTIISPESGFRWSVELDYEHAPATPAPSDVTVAGASPMIDRLTSGQTAQPASVTVIDAVRSGLLGKVVPAYDQNDFCETVDELKACALEQLREQAPKPEFDSPIDWTTKPGAPIAILFPDAIPDDELMTAWNVEWTFDGRMAVNTQHVSARWLPKEMR